MSCTPCLSPRQQALLTDKCDVWETVIQNVAGKPQAPFYRLVVTGQRCKWKFTSNVDAPVGVGRDNDANADTRDTITFPYRATVQNTNWLIDRTILPNGEKAASYGKISRVQGAPEYRHPTARDRFGSFSVKGMVDEHPPAFLVAQI